MDKVQHWLNLCDEDVLTARVLLREKRLLPAGFFCHLIAEKALKAVIASVTNETPPYIHHLKQLSIKAELYDDLSESQLELLKELQPLNIEARYSEYKSSIAETLSIEKLTRLLKETEGFLCWIKQRLEK